MKKTPPSTSGAPEVQNDDVKRTNSTLSSGTQPVISSRQQREALSQIEDWSYRNQKKRVPGNTVLTPVFLSVGAAGTGKRAAQSAVVVPPDA